MADLGFQQGQSLQQNQTITPQMQQSLQVLQAPALELRHLVQQEMEINPVLEDEYQDISLEEQGLDNDDFDSEFEKEFDELSQLDEEWREYMAQTRKSVQRTSEDEEKHAFLLDSLTAPITLQEHLLQQLAISDVLPEIRQGAEHLIGMIDEQGFLANTVSEIALAERLPINQLKEAHTLLKSFDPIGVGATDLQESLLIQLERSGKSHSLEARLVSSHLDDLAKKRYPLLVKKLNVTMEQLSQAAEFIGTLNPHPGRSFQPDRNTYVEADITVTKYQGEWVISLNNNHIPHLRISNSYKDLMAESANGKNVRTYIRDKIRSGKFLIRSIHQRQDTIEKITREIIKHQEAFLENGRSHLKPLNMAQVAEVVGVHETTVSRAVNGKYMSTPQGTFELKYFFTSGYQTEDGESMSNTSVKRSLMDLIKSEPGDKPYSDQDLVTMLNDQGIPIARRTVAKYRKELNILPSNMRRSY